MLLLVNPATSAAGERSFSATPRLKTWLRLTMTQDRLSNLTILNNHKQRTDKLCFLDVANAVFCRNENRKRNFGIFKETDSIIECYHTQSLFLSIAPSRAVILSVVFRTMFRKGSGLLS